MRVTRKRCTGYGVGDFDCARPPGFTVAQAARGPAAVAGTADYPAARLHRPEACHPSVEVDGTDPSNGNTLANVANLGPEDARAAIAAANDALPAWRSKTGKERHAILMKWYQLLMANQEDLGRIMTAEQGKPFPEAKGEVAYGASFVEWFAEEAKRVNGETLPQFDNSRRLVVLKPRHGRVSGDEIPVPGRHA